MLCASDATKMSRDSEWLQSLKSDFAGFPWYLLNIWWLSVRLSLCFFKLGIPQSTINHLGFHDTKRILRFIHQNATFESNGSVNNSISTESPRKSTESPVSTPGGWFDSSLRWQRSLHLSDLFLVALASHPPLLMAPTNAEPLYLVQLFYRDPVAGRSKLQVVSMSHVIIPWSIMWFKKEYFEAPSKSITRKMRQLEYVCHPIPTLLANFARQLIGANLMGLRPWKSPKVGLRRRCIATLHTFQVILRLEMDKGARCQCKHTFNDIRLYMTWRPQGIIMLHLPNVTGTFSPAVCVGLDYLDWQGGSGSHKPCRLHILQLKMGRMRQHPQDLGRPVAHCWQESDKWRTNFGILKLVY